MKEKAKGFVKEFKEFISRGNVLDMAVGVIIATAFGKITTSLVNDVFMPFIGWLIGEMDLTKLNIVLVEEVLNEAGEVVTPGVVIGIGAFISTIIDFILVAFVIFLVLKVFNKAKEKAEAKEKPLRRPQKRKLPLQSPAKKLNFLWRSEIFLKNKNVLGRLNGRPA